MPPAKGSSELVVVDVHGLPRTGVEPTEQLAAVRLAFEPFPGIRNRFATWKWADATYREVARVLQLLKRGRFASTFAPQLADMVQSLGGQRRAFICYSGGGTIFYRWLLNQKTSPDELCAVLIAAPHQCREGFIVFEGDVHQVHYLVNEPALDPRVIAQRFAPGRLLVLLAENDGTILRHNAEFPQDLVEPGHVRQVTIPGASHSTICGDAFSHFQILEHFNQCGIGLQADETQQRVSPAPDLPGP